MRRSAAVLLVAVLGVTGLTVGAQSVAFSSSDRNPNAFSSAPAPPTAKSVEGSTLIYRLSFNGPATTYRFRLQAEGGSAVHAMTKDCCVRGDHWGVTLIRPTGGGEVGTIDPVASACGNGSIKEYTGHVSQRVRSGAVIAVLYYCSGVNQFSAGMHVRFKYAGELTATPIG
jgi:hypothetical protein